MRLPAPKAVRKLTMIAQGQPNREESEREDESVFLNCREEEKEDGEFHSDGSVSSNVTDTPVVVPAPSKASKLFVQHSNKSRVVYEITLSRGSR